MWTPVLSGSKVMCYLVGHFSLEAGAMERPHASEAGEELSAHPPGSLTQAGRGLRLVLIPSWPLSATLSTFPKVT